MDVSSLITELLQLIPSAADKKGKAKLGRTKRRLAKSLEKEIGSNFKAGSTLRSKKMNSKLDETGIFGCSCRHEIPRKFFNLKKGESLANAVFLIQEILKETKSCVKVIVMYDIACFLIKHLEKRNSTVLKENVSFCIPSFHVYGHKSSCQLNFSPKSTVGVGLSDGEVMERQWSANRRFCRITKEQTPSHRSDTLTLAMLHYAKNSVQVLGRRLCGRMEKAKKLTEESENELSNTLASLRVIDRSVIKQWISAEPETEECASNKVIKESS